MKVNSVILGCATITLVILGVVLLAGVVLLPVLLAFCAVILPGPSLPWAVPAVLLAVQIIHLWLLWTSSRYLAFFRMLIYPLRQLSMPLVFLITKIESIREGVPVLYFDLTDIRASIAPGKITLQTLLQYFRATVRKRYKTMEAFFQNSKIRHDSAPSEKALNLSLIIPIMIEQEKRCCDVDGKSVTAEFLKRFLVVFLATHAYLDLYYDQNNKPCCFQLSVRQKQVLHWWMHFCTRAASRSGLWYHGDLLALLRGLEIPELVYVNCQYHQTESKRYAGCLEAPHTDEAMLSKLYPFSFTVDMNLEPAEPSLWAPPEKTVVRGEAGELPK